MSDKLCGLKNLGATGYINCILQQLYHLKNIKYGIINAGIEISNKLSQDELKDSVLYQTMKAFVFMSLSTNSSSFDMKAFCYSYKDYTGMPIQVNIAQDAQEFYTIFMDKLKLELKNTKYKHLLKNTIDLQLCNYLRCESCKKERGRTTSYQLLSVPISGCKDLNESLEKYIETELIEGVFCDHCQAKKNTNSGEIICNLSNILFVHVNVNIYIWHKFHFESDAEIFSFNYIYPLCQKHDLMVLLTHTIEAQL